MRDLKDVINEMLDVIPDNEIELINKLKNIRKEQIYRALKVLLDGNLFLKN
jgi:hypothetical protein